MSESSFGRRGRRTEIYEGTTDANGLATITYSHRFASQPFVCVTLTNPGTPAPSWSLTSESATQCVVSVRRPQSADMVLSTSTEPVSGQQFRLMVTEP